MWGPPHLATASMPAYLFFECCKETVQVHTSKHTVDYLLEGQHVVRYLSEQGQLTKNKGPVLKHPHVCRTAWGGGTKHRLGRKNTNTKPLTS